jgi:hypothetical protein
VEHALLHRRHQLAVLVQQPLGADQQQRVVEAPRALGLALVDTDRAVDAVLGAGRGERVDVRAGDVDRARPHPLPQLVLAVERDGRARPRVGGIERHERLRQHRELRAVGRRLPEQPARLRDGRVGVEHDGRGLDRGDADGPQLGHGGDVTGRVKRRVAGSRRYAP